MDKQQGNPEREGWYECEVSSGDDKTAISTYYWQDEAWFVFKGETRAMATVLRWQGPLQIVEPSQPIVSIIRKWREKYENEDDLSAGEAIESAVVEAVGTMAKPIEPSAGAREYWLQTKRNWERNSHDNRFLDTVVVDAITQAETAAFERGKEEGRREGIEIARENLGTPEECPCCECGRFDVLFRCCGCGVMMEKKDNVISPAEPHPDPVVMDHAQWIGKLRQQVLDLMKRVQRLEERR